MINSPFFSQLAGVYCDSRLSKSRISGIIKQLDIDESEFRDPVESFKSFNDFFIRKLKKECRPFDLDPEKLVSPADCRLMVYPELKKDTLIPVKGIEYSIDKLLAAEYSLFHNGAVAVLRLNPSDYHRFHFPTDGTPSQPKEIPGSLFSVSPVALKRRLSILWENKRMLTEIETGPFGKILYTEVGASCVGTIHQTFQPGKSIKKGDEKGYFSFGGSCIAIFFEKGRIVFDEDLIENSRNGFETKANMGESLGHTE